MLACICAASCAAAPPRHGTVLRPPAPAHRFVLTDQSGAAFALGARADRSTALYFGFTHCRDVCPQTLRKLAAARSRAGLTPLQLQIVMVTVDPKRDTPAAMRAFFSTLHVRARGLTGTPLALARVYRAYGAAVEPQHGDIGHTSSIYLLDNDGRLCELLPPSASTAAIADDLRALVS